MDLICRYSITPSMKGCSGIGIRALSPSWWHQGVSMPTDREILATMAAVGTFPVAFSLVTAALLTPFLYFPRRQHE